MDKLEQMLKPIWRRIAKYPERKDAYIVFEREIRHIIKLTREK